MNSESYGIAAGAALLCSHGRARAALHLSRPGPLPGLPDLSTYAAVWRQLSQGQR